MGLHQNETASFTIGKLNKKHRFNFNRTFTYSPKSQNSQIPVYSVLTACLQQNNKSYKYYSTFNQTSRQEDLMNLSTPSTEMAWASVQVEVTHRYKQLNFEIYGFATHFTSISCSSETRKGEG